MMIVTTPSIEGKTVKKYIGIVSGEGLVGSNVYKDIFSGVRDVVEGRTSNYEREIKLARDKAIKNMEEDAEKLGANAILNVRVKYSNLGGTMGNTILVSISGTAVEY